MEHDDLHKPERTGKVGVFNYEYYYKAIKEFREQDGLWEALLGLFLIFGLLRAAGTINHIGFLRETFFVVVMPIFALTFIFFDRYQAKQIPKYLPEAEKDTQIKDTWGFSHMGWDEMILAPLYIFFEIIGAAGYTIKTNGDEKIRYIIMIGLIMFASLCLFYVVKYFILRFLIWVIATLAIVFLMVYNVITLANFYWFVLVLALVMIVFGLNRHIKYTKSVK